MIKTGQLICDVAGQRMDIIYRDGSFYGGLHCGNTFDALSHGRWTPARVEYRHDIGSWYLTGFDYDENILGLTVRT